MSFSWFVSIEKLMYWRAATWTKFGSKATNLTLRVHYDQLLITADDKVIESLNMHSKIKGIYKEDVLILIVWAKEQNVRKIKFQIKSNVGQCLQKLSEHFPVVNHNSNRSNNVMKSKYRNLEDVIKHLETQEPSDVLKIPSSYSNLVKLCVLDPAFPQMIAAAEKILIDMTK